MPRVSQEEYDAVIRTIEANTNFRFTAGVSDSSAFMLPVDGKGRPLGPPIRLTWDKVKKLAEAQKLKPQCSQGHDPGRAALSAERN